MNDEKLQRILNNIWRIASVPFFVRGIQFLGYLYWDTFWYGLIHIAFGLLFWNQDKVWSLVKQERCQKK